MRSTSGWPRLEHLSLARVLAALHGAREDALAREKAEAEAARYRYAEAQHRLDAPRLEISAGFKFALLAR